MVFGYALIPTALKVLKMKASGRLLSLLKSVVTMDARSLQQAFGIDSTLRFETHPSGLAQGIVKTSECEASFFLHGAHIAHWQPAHTDSPVLFMSQKSYFEPGKPIRGGIPICFPWFSAHPTDSSLPAHGLARQASWELMKTQQNNHVVSVVFELSIDSFDLRYTVDFGSTLQIALNIVNCDSQARDCEVALHTYFDIGAIEQVSVEGLEELPYLDQLTKLKCPAEGTAIRFERETDRIYQGTADEILLHDGQRSRRIAIEANHARSTVVWNPWIEKSKRMPDFGDDEYLRMCCIETANIRENRIQLEPRATTTIAVRYAVAT